SDEDRRRLDRRPADPEIPVPLLPWNSPAPGEPGRLGEARSVGARSRSRWDFRAENRIGGQGIPEESKNRRRRDRRAEDLGENVLSRGSLPGLFYFNLIIASSPERKPP